MSAGDPQYVRLSEQALSAMAEGTERHLDLAGVLLTVRKQADSRWTVLAREDVPSHVLARSRSADTRRRKAPSPSPRNASAIAAMQLVASASAAETGRERARG